jgi:hypothetical protein
MMDDLGFVEQASKQAPEAPEAPEASLVLSLVRCLVGGASFEDLPRTSEQQGRHGLWTATDGCEITGQAFIYTFIIQHGGSPPIGTGPHAEASDHHHLTLHHSTHLKAIAARNERFDLGGV